MASARDEVVALASSAGLYLDPWQQDCVGWILAEKADGNWAAREAGLFCNRQNGKNVVLEAIELAALFLFEEDLILHTAHEFKTALEAYLRIKGLIENTPDLNRLVRQFYSSSAAVGIELKSGQRLKFIARSKSSGRGFSPDRIIFDEALKLFDQSLSALMFSISARPNPQVIYTSSAPIPEPDSDVLRRLYRRGRSGEDGFAFIEYSAPDDCDLDDREAWSQANPGYPHRLSEETIAAELRSLPAEDFKRERLGIVDLEEDEGQWAIPAEHWMGCANPAATIPDTAPLTFALEVEREHQYATVGVAGTTPSGVHVEIAANHAGTAWVAAWAKTRGVTLTIRKNSPAASLIDELTAKGVSVIEVSTEFYARACGQIYSAAAERRLIHRDEGILTAAVRKAVRRNYGDAFVWDQRKAVGVFAPFAAVTLAASKHLEPVESTESVYETRGLVEL